MFPVRIISELSMVPNVSNIACAAIALFLSTSFPLIALLATDTRLALAVSMASTFNKGLPALAHALNPALILALVKSIPERIVPTGSAKNFPDWSLVILKVSLDTLPKSFQRFIAVFIALWTSLITAYILSHFARLSNKPLCCFFISLVTPLFSSFVFSLVFSIFSSVTTFSPSTALLV